jgi:galactokinase
LGYPHHSPAALAAGAFTHRFGGDPERIARGPGRVNLIGEHTDYNEGFVLPLAIDAAVWIAIRPRADRIVRAWSIDFNQAAEFDLDALSLEGPSSSWIDYVKGVAWALGQSGCVLHGWEGAIAGDVPIGAGLSSSAALELATARAFADVSGFAWNPTAIARIAQRAENEWVGVRCGIMDQLVSSAGRAGHAVLIDCRSLITAAVALPPDTHVVVLDTGTRRDLASSAYNERRRQCEMAAQAYGVRMLRDLEPRDLDTPPAGLPAVILKRARHVVTENARVIDMTAALRAGETERIGSLMRDSHRSLRDDFDVSSAALDAMVECAERSGSLGARMTGAGFGGCAVAVVAAAACGGFVDRTLAGYTAATGVTGRAHVCVASDGASSAPAGRGR